MDYNISMGKMKKGILFSAVLFLSASILAAQVVKTPQVFYAPFFSEETDIMADSGCWASLRHVLNQDQAPYFGHDWKSGVYINIFSCDFIAGYGLAEETFHFKAAPQELGDWVFNPSAVISDLRLMAFINLQPLLIGAGFQHDCKHEVDRSSRRLQIHDVLYLILRPSGEIPLITADCFSLQLNLAIEGGVNIPPVFQAAPPQPDIGHLSVFMEMTGAVPQLPGFSVVLDGVVSATGRSPDALVTGLDPVGIDYELRCGLAACGTEGRAAFFIGFEHLTDSWDDFEQQPVDLWYITLELTGGIDP